MDQSETLRDVTLEVKCLCGCGGSSTEEGVVVDLWFSTDEERYHVTFEDGFTTVYIQDNLCFKAMGSVCSVRGTLPDGSLFAFCCLTKRSAGGSPNPDQGWVSHPGPDGYHFAMKPGQA